MGNAVSCYSPLSHNDGGTNSNANGSTVGSSNQLESLPPEIRRQLLLVLDYAELRALVRASPTFHAQYALERRTMLLNCLQRELKSVTPEACVAYQAEMLGSLREYSCAKPMVLKRFRETYHARLDPGFTAVQTNLTEDDAAAVMVQYVTVIKPLAVKYADWALPQLSTLAQVEHQPAPLSKTEELRIIRALYRFQLCCYAFGAYGDGDTRGFGLVYRDDIGPPWRWFATLEPWEIEELTCVYTAIMCTYNQIFREVEEDLHPTNPGCSGQSAEKLSRRWFRLEEPGESGLLPVATLLDEAT
jgi:hypothetical protein